MYLALPFGPKGGLVDGEQDPLIVGSQHQTVQAAVHGAHVGAGELGVLMQALVRGWEGGWEGGREGGWEGQNHGCRLRYRAVPPLSPVLHNPPSRPSLPPTPSSPSGG